MKKININESAYSFENNRSFSKILNNGKVQNCIISFLVGTIILSGGTIYKVGKDIKQNDSYLAVMETIANNEAIDNDIVIRNLIESGIVVANVNSTVDTGYHLDNTNLYDSNNNPVDLTNTTKPFFLISCNISNELFDNISLSSSCITSLCLDMSSINDAFVEYLPNTLTELSLYKCNYVTNLEKLPATCPNISRLYLNNMPSLSNLDFIYNLPNLTEVYLSNSAYISQDLLNYLNDKHIRTNITESDLEATTKVDNIIDAIIKPNMSDKEKLQAISLYVLDNLEYDISTIGESNDNPLTFALNNKKGVCTSYAYLTNVLLNKANLNSFNVSNDTHSWNIIELDGEYYYLDTTKLDASELYQFFLKTIKIPKTYLTNISIKDDDTTIIPPALIDDIIAGKEVKNNHIPRNILMISGIIAGLTIFLKSKNKSVNNSLKKK